MNRLQASIAVLALALAGCSAEDQGNEAVAPVTPVVPEGDVHALFVGIDDYQFSRDQDRNAELSDLQGAVGDVVRIKSALNEVYGLAVDRASEGDCESSNDISITLTDSCATRERVLGALDAKIDELEAGDTLLFYFAGHGSRYRDDEAFDQDSGYNGTILPYDARNPDGSPGDIFDIELKQRKDRATAKGLYFVSIFDSCNSGTATRDGATGQSRSVPVLAQGSPTLEQQSGGRAETDGYWVHLAAAQDGEDAQETPNGAIGERAGVFTTALIETLRMPGMAKASFGDIINEVQLRVAQNGATSQTPSAEGRLSASLGATSRDVVLFDANFVEGDVVIEAGSSSGITEGSRFAFYALQGDAVAGTAPLATGYVATVESGTARVELDREPSEPFPDSLVAERTAHFYPAETVVVENALTKAESRDLVESAMESMDFVKPGSGGIARLTSLPDGGIALLSADGTLLANDFGDPNASEFPERLEQELQKLARVQQLLSLRTGSDQQGEDISVCIASDGYRATSCPPIDRGGVRHLATEERITATLINRSDTPRYLYLLAIDPRNAVDLVLPRPGELDSPIAPGQPYRRGPFAFDLPGNYRFVTIVTDTPIRADAFEQSGNGTRDIQACRSPLERLLCSASKGTRDTSVTRVGDWSVGVTTAVVN